MVEGLVNSILHYDCCVSFAPEHLFVEDKLVYSICLIKAALRRFWYCVSLAFSLVLLAQDALFNGQTEFQDRTIQTKLPTSRIITTKMNLPQLLHDEVPRLGQFFVPFKVCCITTRRRESQFSKLMPTERKAFHLAEVSRFPMPLPDRECQFGR